MVVIDKHDCECVGSRDWVGERDVSETVIHPGGTPVDLVRRSEWEK